MFTPTVKRREDPDFPSISQPMQEFLLFCLPVASSKFLLKLVFLLGNLLLKAAVSKWLTLLSRVHFVLCLSSSCRIVLWYSQHSWGTFSATKTLLTRFTLRPVLQRGKSFSNNNHDADAVIYWFEVRFCCSLQLPLRLSLMPFFSTYTAENDMCLSDFGYEVSSRCTTRRGTLQWSRCTDKINQNTEPPGVHCATTKCYYIREAL